MAKIKDKNLGEVEVDNNQSQLTNDGSVKPKREKKKIVYTGSRWAGIVLLILTIVFSLMFYAKGKFSETGISIGGMVNKLFTEVFGQQTYTYEK